MKKRITKKALQKAITVSARLEGMSFTRAKKNIDLIKLLKKHGRAFSL